MCREDGFVRKVGNAVDAGNGRDKRRGACCDDGSPGLDLEVARGNGIGVGKFRAGSHDIGAQSGEALRRSFGRCLGNDAFDEFSNFPMVHTEVGSFDAKAPSVLHIVETLRGRA